LRGWCNVLEGIRPKQVDGLQERARKSETLKSRITDEEKSKLLVLAESLVPKEEIFSLCAFGSRVAWHESEDSGYDLVIVTKNLKEKIIDRHEQLPKPPPLIVDHAALFKEAEQPSPDELAVVRFLNVYEPIVNAEFLRTVEIEYKKRVIAEELIELQSDYGDFSSNLIIPYGYFLFDKLHEKALAHPEAIDGYARTYTGALREENLEFTLRGFREAAELLASRGITQKTDDSVRIFRGRKKRMNALSMLYKMYPLTTGGAIQYALHSFANRAGFEFKTKPLPKLRIMEKVESSVELDRPNKLLLLEEGVVFDDASKMIEEVAQMSGFGETYAYEEKKMGDLVNSTKKLEIWGDARRAKFMLKHFPELKSVKWFLLNLWSLSAKKFNMSPLSRLHREVEAARRLRELGIKTHRITGIILDERTLVTEYSEGVPLDKSILEITTGKSTDTSDIKRYARVLGKLHKSGLVYGDTKPQNALVGKDGIVLLDLEQAVEGGDEAWDIAEFLYYSGRLAKQEGGMTLVAESFLSAYRSENGGQVIAKARKTRYLLPFILFIAPRMRKVVRKALAEFSSAEAAAPPVGEQALPK